MFRFGCFAGIVPSETLAQVVAAEGFRRGEIAEMPEPVRRRPIDEATVKKTAEHLNPTLRAVVWVLW